MHRSSYKNSGNVLNYIFCLNIDMKFKLLLALIHFRQTEEKISDNPSLKVKDASRARSNKREARDQLSPPPSYTAHKISAIQIPKNTYINILANPHGVALADRTIYRLSVDIFRYFSFISGPSGWQFQSEETAENMKMTFRKYSF